jgi:hypothetical protein
MVVVVVFPCGCGQKITTKDAKAAASLFFGGAEQYLVLPYIFHHAD